MRRFIKLWDDSTKELKKTRVMVFCSMMAVIAIVISYTTTIQIGPSIRIGFSGLPNRVIDYLFGPIIGGIFGGTLDIFKYLVKPTGPFFFGFTFNAILSGVIYGTLLYNKPIRIWRVVTAEMLIKAIVNCGLNTLWLSMLYGDAFMVILPARALKNLIMLPIDSIILLALLTYVEKTIKPMIMSWKNDRN